MNIYLQHYLYKLDGSRLKTEQVTDLQCRIYIYSRNIHHFLVAPIAGYTISGLHQLMCMKCLPPNCFANTAPLGYWWSGRERLANICAECSGRTNERKKSKKGRKKSNEEQINERKGQGRGKTLCR